MMPSIEIFTLCWSCDDSVVRETIVSPFLTKLCVREPDLISEVVAALSPKPERDLRIRPCSGADPSRDEFERRSDWLEVASEFERASVEEIPPRIERDEA